MRRSDGMLRGHLLLLLHKQIHKKFTSNIQRVWVEWEFISAL